MAAVNQTYPIEEKAGDGAQEQVEFVGNNPSDYAESASQVNEKAVIRKT